jgi:exosome complex RNA-binding protein Rrp4
MPFENLYRIAFGERKISNHTKRKDVVSNDNNVVAPYDTTKDATELEITKLEERFGELKEGMEVSITLQEINNLIPKSRVRTDAYCKLVSALKRIGVTLIITSRKKKRHETLNCI